MNGMRHSPGMKSQRGTVRIFLCGDVMTGRGIDQVLGHPCSPELYEDYMRSAEDYVRLAEEANGPIPRHNEPSYIWGAALAEFDRLKPDARIINLETAITRSDDRVDKGINYRMSPENAACLVTAGIDCCVLANNHVLDWGHRGLSETLATLQRSNISVAGAGRDDREAGAPAVLEIPDKIRILVFSFGSVTSGVPRDWAATSDNAGINLLSELSEAEALRVADQITAIKRPGDLVVVSIHWGANWGYHIPSEQQAFARTLVDKAGVAIVHGHSSHHPRAIEIYRSRLIFYGCGDFLNDYEGIRGFERYRDDLALMYFADVEPDAGMLQALKIVPLQIKRFQLLRPSSCDISFVQQTLDRESRQFGTRVALESGDQLSVSWPSSSSQLARVD
jgi:poly-gamma-glutamate synthesis protein (capsule biosynthesis protein)